MNRSTILFWIQQKKRKPILRFGNLDSNFPKETQSYFRQDLEDLEQNFKQKVFVFVIVITIHLKLQ